MKFASIIAALAAALATPAAAQSLERQHYLDREQVLDLLRPPAIACPDQQTIDEVEAMRRLGDREGEFITGRSYGCGPVIRLRPGPFER
jgi:hypothetical protein